MAPVSVTSAPAGRSRTRHYGFTLTGLVRSLVGKLILLLIVFVIVPVILYSEFRQADAEKRVLLLESARAQGHLIAESLRPLLRREGAASLPELNDAIRALATKETGIKVLYQPADGDGISGFFFVASEPPAAIATLDEEREQLRERGVLDRLTESCEGAIRHQMAGGREQLLTSITPVTTQAGCWAVITPHSTGEILGTAIDRPYWKTIEVRIASWIYFAMAVVTIGLFFTIWRGLRRFRDMARGISVGGTGGPSFAAQNQVPELAFVTEEFDRMTGALRDSAENLRQAAEDNAHAFKTPIAIMRQSLEPLRRLVPENDSRGRRALEVIEESVDRLGPLGRQRPQARSGGRGVAGFATRDYQSFRSIGAHVGGLQRQLRRAPPEPQAGDRARCGGARRRRSHGDRDRERHRQRHPSFGRGWRDRGPAAARKRQGRPGGA